MRTQAALIQESRIRVVAFMKYGGRAASTRQRLLQYLPHLRSAGIDVEFLPLLGNDHLERVADGKSAALPHVAKNYARRFWQLTKLRHADIVWVHCELFPYLPGFFERLVRVTKTPMVYDFDDAIFHMYDRHPSGLVRRSLGKKLVPLLRSASACSCGNTYLAAYASLYCGDCRIFPTVVDTRSYVPVPKRQGVPLVVGWIGSPSTWPYVQPMLGAIRAAADRSGARVRVIGAGPSAKQVEGIEAVDWSEEREIAEVQGMDIGIMPVPDEPWERGKSGYKLIQYGACGLPVIASPVGVNREIVLDGATGFLASTQPEWEAHLTRLLSDPPLRLRLGTAGRKRVEEHYSLQVHAARMVQLLHDVLR
jgi:glycosyltransferase involved in cell wall biosynthesis